MNDAGFRKVMGILIVIILLLVFWQLANVLLLAFAGLLLAVLLRHMTMFVTRHTPLGDGIALGVVVVFLIVLFGAGFTFLGPRVADEGRQLVSLLPQSVEAVQDLMADQAWAKFLVDRAPKPDADTGWNLLGTIGGTMSIVVGAVANFVIFIFIGLFLAASPQLYRKGVLHLVPMPQRDRALEVMDAVGRGLWLWLQGQLIDMSIVAVLTGFGLWLLGVPLAVTLGLIAGITNIIPYVGPFLSGVPAVLIAFTLGVNEAIYTALLFLAVQQFDGHVIMPIIQKRSTSLPPILTILAVIGFGALFGFIGVLVATPLILVVMIMVQMLYVEDVLGDHSLANHGAQADIKKR